MTNEQTLSRRELQTLFYVGRQLELVDSLLGPCNPQSRVVKAHRSYGYDMQKADGKVSRLDFESGQKIIGVSPAGNGYTEVKIMTAEGELAAHYLLVSELDRINHGPFAHPTAVFDSRSGIRERLFLLSVLKDDHDSANWAYDPHRDTWSHVGGDELQVEYEGSKSLETLAKRGVDYKTAMEMIGYPEK